MDFKIKHFTGTMPSNGKPYVIRTEDNLRDIINEPWEYDGNAEVTCIAKINIWKNKQWQYFDHASRTDRSWKNAFYEALLALELRHNIDLIELDVFDK